MINTRYAPEIIERFSRQLIVKEIGVKGFKKIRETRVVIIGCGATGSLQAELLARLGIGFIRLVDKDYVDLSNLPRTHLYTYSDVEKALPKSIACAKKIKEIDPGIEVEPVIARVTPDNIEEIVKNIDIIIDGTDNLSTRFLINDVAVKHGIPWIFIGFETWYGNIFFINPGKGPCLRCIIPLYMLRREEESNACEVLGAVNTVLAILAGISTTLVLKHILGIMDNYNTLYIVNGKTLDLEKIIIKKHPKCPVCTYKKFEFLEKREEENVTRICGTNAIEIVSQKKTRLDLARLAKYIRRYRVVTVNPYTLKIRVNEYISIILFNDGRAIIDGTVDKDYALKLYREILNELDYRGDRE